MGSPGLTDPAQAEEQQVALGHKAWGSLSCLSSQNLTHLLIQTLLCTGPGQGQRQTPPPCAQHGSPGLPG